MTMAAVTSLVLALTLLLAQAPPNFSGQWMVDYDRSKGRGPRGQVADMRVLDESFVAEQTGETLVLALVNEMGLKSTYRLDGGESENLSVGPRGVTKTISRANWSGSTLTITTRAAEGPESARGFLKLSKNPDGTIRVEAGPGDGDDVRMVSVYKPFPKG